MSNGVKITQEDADAIPHGAWRLMRQDESMRYWEADLDLPNGQRGTIGRTEYLESELLLGLNAEMRKESSEHRYTAGMGSDKGGNMPLVQTGSIPLNVYYAELVPYIKQGDREHLRWWLNRDENRKFKTTDKQTRK